MKQTIFLSFLLLTLSSFAQEKNCSDFKVGEFTYTDPDYADLVTVRTDSLQTDSYPEMGWEMTSSIRWISDCKYEIEYIDVNDSKLESIIGVKYVIEIIEINENKILCRTESDGISVEKEMIKTD
jgi:hypothetical protein